MAKDPQQRRGDQQDNKRVFRWGIGAVIVLILAALVFNSFIRRPDTAPSSPGTPAAETTPNPLGAGAPK
jgi:hypothetical protein